MPYKHGFGPFAPEIYRAPMAYPLRWPGGPEHCAEQAFTPSSTWCTPRSGRPTPRRSSSSPSRARAASSYPRSAGCRRSPDFCAEHGIVLVADEIQTGFCRTGDWFACDHEDVVPDLITTAKGIAGGLPLSAVTGRAEIMDSVHPGGLGGTYGGNPVACAAALGAIETMREPGPVRPGAADRDPLPRPPRAAARQVRRDRRDPRPRRHARHRADAGAGDLRPTPPRPRRSTPLPQPGPGHPDRRAPTATCSASCRPWSPPTTCSVEGLDIIEDAFAHVLGCGVRVPPTTSCEVGRMNEQEISARPPPVCSSAASGATPPTARTIDVEDPATGKTLLTTSPRRPSRTARRRSTPRSPPRPTGPPPRRASAQSCCAPPSS